VLTTGSDVSVTVWSEKCYQKPWDICMTTLIEYKVQQNCTGAKVHLSLTHKHLRIVGVQTDIKRYKCLLQQA